MPRCFSCPKCCSYFNKYLQCSARGHVFIICFSAFNKGSIKMWFVKRNVHKYSLSALFTTAKKWKQPKHSSVDEWLKKIRSSPRGILFSPKKEWSSDTRYDVGEPWEHDAKGKKPATQRPHTVWFHSYDMPRGSQSVETEGRLVVARGRREGGRWGVTAKGYGVSLGWWKYSHVDCGDGCTTLNTRRTPLEMVLHFITY